MSRGTEARAAILARIRSALEAQENDSRLSEVEKRLAEHRRGTVPRSAGSSYEQRLAHLMEFLSATGTDLLRTDSPEGVVRAIANYLESNGLPLLLRLGSDVVLNALPWQLASTLTLQPGAAAPEDKVCLSRAVAAAAETGTLFLVSGPENPTTLNFLPETHLVLLQSQDIVGCYEEAWDRLREAYPEGLPRRVNLVSGPSRTADIEQTIIRGAHGPKRVCVLILEQQS